jgi:hypothetical protein
MEQEELLQCGEVFVTVRKLSQGQTKRPKRASLHSADSCGNLEKLHRSGCASRWSQDLPLKGIGKLVRGSGE